MARVETAIRIVIDFYAAWNRHAVDDMLRLVSAACVFEVVDGTSHIGTDAIARYWRSYFAETTDAHITVEDVSGLGLRCVARWRCDWRDTHGKHDARGVDIFQVESGLITHQFSYVKR